MSDSLIKTSRTKLPPPVVRPIAPAPGPAKRKVLLVSLFHPELVRGGAQQICYELFEGLRADPDIEPVLLASIDSSYPALYKSGARITGFDGRPNEFLYLSADYDHLWHKTGSPLHIEAFVEFLELIQPEVVHFHHFLTLGIDLITLTRRILPDCRIVFTFHEFLSICDAHGHMVRTTDKSLCTHASPVRCHQCFPGRSPEQFLMRKMWFMRHLEVADAYTCPSRFMIEHYVRWGLPREKIRHVTNGQRNYGLTGRTTPAPGPKTRFGFFGQMVDAKGVHIILRAVSLLRGEGFTGFTVELNGDNLRFASEGVRKEIEDFLALEAERPPAGSHRDPQRLLPGGPAGVAHGADRLVHGAVDLVGDLRAGDLGGLDVRQARDLLQCRWARGTNPA